MSDAEPTSPFQGLSRGSYANQWGQFVAWSLGSGKQYLPATPEDVAAYLKDRWNSGAKPSTLRVVASAIARAHMDAGLDVPLRHPIARSALENLTRGSLPAPSRTLPLDLDCYLAIRKTAYEPRSGRGGRSERVLSARLRGDVDVAMIGLMRDARLRVSEAAALTWVDVELVADGTGRVRVGDTSYRVVSSDTMRLLALVRRGSGNDELVFGMKPNQIAIRIGAAARQAGLGDGFSGDSPRLGMIRDLENLGALLLGGYVADSES